MQKKKSLLWNNNEILATIEGPTLRKWLSKLWYIPKEIYHLKVLTTMEICL